MPKTKPKKDMSEETEYFSKKRGTTKLQKRVARDRFNMALDYYADKLSIKELEDKYNVTYDTVLMSKKIYSHEFVRKHLRSKKETAIIIDLNDAPRITRVLDQLGLKYRYPQKEHVIEEFYESKMNG